MDKLFEDVLRNTVVPGLRGKGIQIGGIRLTDDITRVELFASSTFKAQGKDVTVPSDTLLLFSQGEMDYVVLPLSIETVPDPVRILREVRRVLKEKGELYIVAVDGRKTDRPVFEDHQHSYTPAFLARLVETAAGFSIKALREVGETGLVLLKAERNTRADARIPFVTYMPGFVEAARSPEGCAELYFQLGILFMQIGDTTRSLDAFHQVLAFEPECSEAYGGLGMAALCGEDKASARQWFEKAMALDPGNSDYRKWLELAMEGDQEEDPSQSRGRFIIPRPENEPAGSPAPAPTQPVAPQQPVTSGPQG